MPTEPERDIEKTLRAYAKKRQEEAGAPAEMHPATRKLLQGEIARLRPNPPEKSSFWTRVLGQSWPQMALRVSAFVLLATTAAILVVSSLSNSKHETQLAALRPRDEQAAAEKRSLQKEPDVDQSLKSRLPAEAPARREALDDAGRAQSLAKQDRPSNQNDVNANESDAVRGRNLVAGSVVAPQSAPPVTNLEKDKFADGSGNLAVKALPKSTTLTTSGAFDSLAESAASRSNSDYKSTPAGGVPTAPAAADFANARAVPPASPPPAASSVISGGGNFSPVEHEKNEINSAAATAVTNPITQLFARTSQAIMTRKKPGSSGQLVLSSFRVEQTGNQLRIIDSDGSVYSGVLEPAGQDSKPVNRQMNSTAVSGATRENAAGAAAAQPAQTETSGLGGMVQPVQNYFFRVSGTNLSLNQSVVFSGSFIPDIQSSPSAKLFMSNGPAKSNSPAPNAGPAKLPLLKSRLQGRVMIGGTNQGEINALPVNP